MTRRHPPLLLTIITAALGCSGSGIPEDRFCADYAQVQCRTLAGWCGLTTDECQAGRQAACERRVQALRLGSRPYDKVAAAGCIDTLARVYRSQPISVAGLRELEATCERVHHGNSNVGEGCRAAVDCQRGLICRNRCLREVDVPADGACGEPGSRCPTDHHCANLSGGQGRNTVQVCRPSMGLDQSCAAQPCQDNLRCQDMVCISRLPLETECERDLDCALPAAYCNPYTGLCADSLTFTAGSLACRSQVDLPVTSDASQPDRRAPGDAEPAETGAD